jgi:hypothetical protein
MKKRRIKHNDLLPWFIRDHGTLPASYLRSCKEFFKAGREDAEMYKRQASSSKRLTADPGEDRMYLERNNHE